MSWTRSHQNSKLEKGFEIPKIPNSLAKSPWRIDILEFTMLQSFCAMWKYIQALPVDLTVDNVLAHFGIRELARLEKAWPHLHRAEFCQPLFSRIQGVDLPIAFQASPAIQTWALKHHIYVKRILMHDDCTYALQLLSDNTGLVQETEVWYNSKRPGALIKEMANDLVLCKVVTGSDIVHITGAICEEVIQCYDKFSNLVSLDVYFDHREDVTSITTLLQTCKQLTKLIFRYGIEPTPPSFSLFVCETMRQLTSLTVHCDNLSDNDVRLLAKTCTRLQDLDLFCGHRRQWDSKLAANSFLPFATKNKNLKTIIIMGEIQDADIVLNSFLLNCKELRDVNILSTFSTWIDETTLNAAVQCPLLEGLHGLWAVTCTLAVKSAVSFLRRLKILDVRLYLNISTDNLVVSLCHALTYCNNLTSLQLSAPASQLGHLFEAAVGSCRTLKHLHISDNLISDTAPTAYASSCLSRLVFANAATLQELVLHCKYLPAGMTADVLSSLRVVEKVDLRGDEVQLTDETICVMAQSCPRLRQIGYLSSNITDCGVLALVPHCRRLRSLDLRDCILVTEAALTQIAQRCDVGVILKLPRALRKDAAERIEAVLQQRRELRKLYFRL